MNTTKLMYTSTSNFTRVIHKLLILLLYSIYKHILNNHDSNISHQLTRKRNDHIVLRMDSQLKFNAIENVVEITEHDLQFSAFKHIWKMPRYYIQL